jgi:hypothetical protein
MTDQDQLQRVEPQGVRALTDVVRRALGAARDRAMIDDLLFLERWELSPTPGTAEALRISQIRRANPELAAAVRAEISAGH